MLISGKSDECLIGMSKQGNGITYLASPKYKDYLQKDVAENGYGWKWTAYMIDEQRLSGGVLMFYPYTTIKVLPTYDDETLDRDIFQNSMAIGPCSYLRYTKYIILPSDITTIPDKTFYNYDVLEDINLNSITTIGNDSFYGCKSLKSVQFSKKNNVTIGKAAFSDCGLVDIEIPNSVKKIGERAFSNNYITDPKSLEHNATTYEKYKEYQEYINEEKKNEEKVLSVNSVSISLCDEGLDLEPDAFLVDDTCQVSITYQKESDKPVFGFINQNEDKWEGSDISATQLNSLKHIAYLRSEKESSSEETTEDGNHSNGVYTVTLVKNARTVPEEWKIQVQNGKIWKDYLKEFEQNNQIWNFYLPHIKDVHYNFNGWKKEDGQFIEYNDTIELYDDLTLYTDYSITGDGLKNQKIILKFYGYDKTVEVTIGTKLYEYDIPKPHRSNDEFLGWVLSKDYPIKKTSNIISKDTIVQWDLYQLDNVLYPVYQSDIMDKSLIATTEVWCVCILFETCICFVGITGI